MKIALVGQNYHIVGGSDQVLIDEERSLTALGHNVAPFAASSPKNFKTDWDRYFPTKTSTLTGRNVTDVARAYYSRDAALCFEKFLDDFRPDIIHCHIYYGKLTASILSKAVDRNIPIIQTLHEYKMVCPTYQLVADGEPCRACRGFKYYNAVALRCNRGSIKRSLHSVLESYISKALGSYRNIDLFLTVSDFQRRTLVEMGMDPTRMRTLYNGIDLHELPSVSGNGSNYAYLGRLENVKGIWELIRAFEMRPALNLLVMGDGSERKNLQDYIQQQGIENVRLLGFCSKEQRISWLMQSKCVIVPSKWNETFGLVAIEALAMGLPVICSDLGGLPEVVIKDEDSIVLESVTADGICAALDKTENLGEELRKMGAQGKKRVRATFDLQSHAAQLVKIYQEVVNVRKSPIASCRER